MDKKSEMFKAVREALSGKREETAIEKNALYDKRTKQVSLRIPRDICIRKKISKDSKFMIVLNPSEKTLEHLKKLDFVIYLKEKEE